MGSPEQSSREQGARQLARLIPNVVERTGDEPNPEDRATGRSRTRMGHIDPSETFATLSGATVSELTSDGQVSHDD
jgi:hypothetical protein